MATHMETNFNPILENLFHVGNDTPATTIPIQIAGGVLTAIFGTVAKNCSDWSIRRGHITSKTHEALTAEGNRWVQYGTQNLLLGIIRAISALPTPPREQPQSPRAQQPNVPDEAAQLKKQLEELAKENKKLYETLNTLSSQIIERQQN